MTAFLDTNVLIAALDDQAQYHQWAVGKLEEIKSAGPAIIADIVYCEFSVAMRDKVQVDQAIGELGLERMAEDDESLFRAGKAFKAYREANNGPKLNVLPDFLIGALAETAGAPLVTSNPKDFTGYFPNLQLITP